MQPFNIPTASLEKSLLIGDFLMVSKTHFGARPHMTAVSLPMVHDSIPLTKTKSFLSEPQYPYFRFPGFSKIKKNDIVVFNWPADTVRYFFEPKGKPGVIKPLDKRSNYVKRCQGVAGDKLSVVDGITHINDKPLALPERSKVQYEHFIYSAKTGINPELLDATGSTDFCRSYVIRPTSQEQLDAVRPYMLDGKQKKDNSIIIKTPFNGIPQKIIDKFGISVQIKYDSIATANITLKAAEELRANKTIDSVIRMINKKDQVDVRVFPHNTNWTDDNFGPLNIPKAGEIITLTAQNINIYKRIIDTYENNELQIQNGIFTINGQITKTYTIKQNYYWMMGDNRHHSEDSRYWGFVPEDHIVGKPVFIWLSIDPNVHWTNLSKKIRWDRMFTTVEGEGKPFSFFWIFIGLLSSYFIISALLKRKKLNK